MCARGPLKADQIIPCHTPDCLATLCSQACKNRHAMHCPQPPEPESTDDALISPVNEVPDKPMKDFRIRASVGTWMLPLPFSRLTPAVHEEEVLEPIVSDSTDSTSFLPQAEDVRVLVPIICGAEANGEYRQMCSNPSCPTVKQCTIFLSFKFFVS